MMFISEVDYDRDGGTITFTIYDDAIAGVYRLPIAYDGRPRPILRDSQPLPLHSPAEAELLARLQAWLTTHLTDDLRAALRILDDLPEWRNLPEALDEAVPFHHIRHVIHYLAPRHSSTPH